MLFESLPAYLEIAKALNGFVRREQKDHRLNDQVCKALQTLYFPPNGVLGLLKELARGNTVASEELRERADQFQ
jgi:hypothetical protein